MRPPILSKYPVDKIISNFKSSKEKEMWIVRFIPQILNKQKINANAISVMKRISLLRLEPLTNQETDKIKKLMIEIGREDIKCVRQTEAKQKNVLIFCGHDDAPESIDGIERYIYRIIPNAKLKFGVADMNRDRCCIVKDKYWESDKKRPTGVYSLADLAVVD